VLIEFSKGVASIVHFLSHTQFRFFESRLFTPQKESWFQFKKEIVWCVGNCM